MAVRANVLSGRDWLMNSFSVWRDLPRDGDRKAHPASFPVSLVQKILNCYAKSPNTLVFDPFAGSGSTLLAATYAGMPSVGFDVNAKYKDIFTNRLDLFNLSKNGNGEKIWRYEICNARECPAFFNLIEKESVDLCITSPPYWNILNRRRTSDGKKSISYSDSDADIGNISCYDEFLSALGDVIENVGLALKDRCYLILNVMDLRKGSIFYPLHQDTVTVVKQRSDLVLDDIIIWDRQKDYNQMRPLGYPYKFIINKVHEYLLVFRKKG